ncbi:MAG: S8 family serine peptidase [Gemmatales bacterium]|nr:S8 family serine peptidase [Gemmatales bacterium]MDW8386041.1 S8 family serine peptidase [Gemmatales bacterium]
MTRSFTMRRNSEEGRRFRKARLRLETLEDRVMLNAGSILPSFPAPQNPNEYLSDRILVRFRENVNPQLSVQAVPGASLGARELLTGYNLWTVMLPPGMSVASAIAAYSANPNVLYAEPDYVLHASRSPNDPRYTDGSLWGLHNYGQSGGTADADIDAPEAWDITVGSNSVVIAVIDTGVDYNHPDLAANMWRNPGEIAGNGIDDDGNGYVDDVYGYDFFANDGDPMDENNHGTHCAGTIGGVGNNGVGVVGVNWNVRIMALRFLGANGSGSTSGAVASLNYALDMGVKISSNSYGGGGFSQSFSNALDRARNLNHVFVAAAGNNGTQGASYPAAYPQDNIIAVAASDRNDNLASFSQWGNNVDLAAPGVSIWSTVRNNGYASYNGTSMATPHVAGVVGLIRAVDPNLGYQQVVSAILNNVDVKSQLVGKVVTGGRLNAYRAVNSVVPPSDTSGPYVTSHSPTGTVAGPVNEVTVTFSEPINATTFTTADIVSFTGPGGVDLRSQITGISPSSGTATTFRIQFSSQSTFGNYTLVFGPDIRDVAGNPMDQNRNNTNGEVPQDRYTATFALNETQGPRVTGHTPNGSVVGPINSLTVTFDEPIDAATFTTADIASFTGPGGVDLRSQITGISPSSGTATSFTITFNDQSARGTYRMTIGPDIRDVAGNPMDQNRNGVNGEATEDQYTAEFDIAFSRSVYHSTNVPQQIRDRRTTWSTLTIPDNINISDLNIRFYITHTWVGDLRIQLQAPNGTTVTLVNYRGGSGDNFGTPTQHTELDDEAAIPISSGTAPFAGSYRPESTGPLSRFDGMSARGTWTLIIYDRANGDQGTLNAWSLVVTTDSGGGSGFRSAFTSTTSNTSGKTSEDLTPAMFFLGGQRKAEIAREMGSRKSEAASTRVPRSVIQATDRIFAAASSGAKASSATSAKLSKRVDELAASFFKA